MAHTALTQELREQIVLYALGELDEAVTREFSTHLSGCTTCTQELQVVQTTLGMVGYGTAAVSPPPNLKARLLERMQAAASTRSQPLLARKMLNFAALAWEPADYPGVSFHWLRQDQATGTAAALVKIHPGCRYGDHLHRGGEDCLVLQGGFRDQEGEYHAGDFVYYAPGSIHHAFEALEGAECILFVVAHGGLELLPTG